MPMYNRGAMLSIVYDVIEAQYARLPALAQCACAYEPIQLKAALFNCTIQHLGSLGKCHFQNEREAKTSTSST